MKRLHILYICLFFLAILFWGCCAETPPTAPPEPLPAAAAQTTPPTTAPTVVPTQPTEPPDLSLAIAAGVYQLQYTDDASQDYMDYCLFIPENARQNMPLIIFLHGDGEVGRPDILPTYGIWGRMYEIYGNDFPFIGLSPCTHVGTWTSETVSGITMELIGHVVGEYDIDPDRIILSGHSLGAIGMWHLVNKHGDYFAGAVPVSCGTDETLDYQTMSTVPVLGIVGNAGKTENNYKRAMSKIINHIKEAGGTAELIVVEGMSHENSSSLSYSEAVFEWMLEQKRSDNNEEIQ